MKFRYTCSGRWFKGNPHTHSTMSDGSSTYEEICALYDSLNYDFLFTTDHNYTEDTSKYSSDKLLLIPGIEIDGADRDNSFYHIVGLDFDHALASSTWLSI